MVLSCTLSYTLQAKSNKKYIKLTLRTHSDIFIKLGIQVGRLLALKDGMRVDKFFTNQDWYWINLPPYKVFWVTNLPLFFRLTSTSKL